MESFSPADGPASPRTLFFLAFSQDVFYDIIRLVLLKVPILQIYMDPILKVDR